jgi:hypothetical protein
MGRIDAIIPEELENKVRIEVVKRLGGKKGDLQKAVMEALEMWVNSDVTQKLKQKAMKKGTTITERIDIVDTLKTMGRWALPALGDLLEIEDLTITEVKAINSAIRQLQTS